MKRSLPILVAISLWSATGCERKTVVVEERAPILEPVARTKTLETARLGGAIDTYEVKPTADNRAEVKKAFAELDGEVAELEQYIAKHEGERRAEAAAKLQNLQSYRAAETLRFGVAEAKAGVLPAEGVDARSGAQKIEDSAHKAGNKIEGAAKDLGRSVKDVFQ